MNVSPSHRIDSCISGLRREYIIRAEASLRQALLVARLQPTGARPSALAACSTSRLEMPSHRLSHAQTGHRLWTIGLSTARHGRMYQTTTRRPCEELKDFERLLNFVVSAGSSACSDRARNQDLQKHDAQMVRRCLGVRPGAWWAPRDCRGIRTRGTHSRPSSHLMMQGICPISPSTPGFDGAPLNDPLWC